MVAIVWFRNDLRLDDSPALLAAVKSGYEVLPLYILDRETIKLGSANRWWLHHSLESLAKSIQDLGGKLILRSGNALEVLKDISSMQSIQAIYWNRRYDSDGCEQDKVIKAYFKTLLLEVESFNGNFLFDPYSIKNSKGLFFQVFTPFWQHCLNAYTPIETPLSKPKREDVRFAQNSINSDCLDRWGFLPKNPNWAKGFEGIWNPGEYGALSRLKNFLNLGLSGYSTKRDFPGIAVTSKLSPHLRFGEISPRTVWHEVKSFLRQNPDLKSDADSVLREIGWREFANYLLYHCPKMPYEPLKKEFLNFPWNNNEEFLKKWQQGRTGYPIVDAGMRELWSTGWMHNRVRMIAASFLIKHLQIHWKQGEEWFFDTLVDADMASNSMNWQWVAGSGCDAAPYFRIFNPTLQGVKFDSGGSYIRKWVDELKDMRSESIHTPWKVHNVYNYSRPIVEHSEARNKALCSYEQMKLSKEMA